MLNQRILSAFENDLTTLVDNHNIARAIDCFRISMVQRILHKGKRSLFGIVVIAHSQRSATYTEFTFFAGFCHQLVVRIQNKDIRVAARESDGNRLLILNFPVDNETGTIKRNLDRTIQIGKRRLRQHLAPVVKLLGRKYLACKPYSL